MISGRPRAWQISAMASISAHVPYGVGLTINAAAANTVAINGLPFRIVGLMPSKTQNSSYNGLDSDKIFIPYSTMVRDAPLTDENFHPFLPYDSSAGPASPFQGGGAIILLSLGTLLPACGRQVLCWRSPCARNRRPLFY